MKRTRLSRSTPEQIRAWRRRSAEAQRRRAREVNEHKYRRLGGRRSRKERDEKFRREYGSKERVRWIQGLPCVFCGRRPCDNAHVANEGMGRKAHHTMIVPACSDRQGPEGLERGCHWQMDRGKGKRAMEREYGIDLYAQAQRIAREWRER